MIFLISRIKLLVLALVFSVLAFSYLSPAVMAVDLFPNEVCNGQTNNRSAVCKDSNSSGNPIYGKNSVLASAIHLLSIAIGIAAVIMIMYAGLKYITSGTNPQEVTKSREMIIYALVGLIIAASAQILVRAVLSKL